jgi:hypothetical protein
VEGSRVQRPDGDFHLLAVANPDDPDDPGSRAASFVRLLTVDGNRDGPVVLFNHDGHIEREGGEGSCVQCHHLNLPFDRGTSCYECHRDMYEATPLFSHASHVEKLDGNAGCSECHSEELQVRSRESATACAECHSEPAGATSVIPAAQPRWRAAPGYMDAMHELCVTCHTERAELEPQRFGDLLDRCDACHNTDTEILLRRMAPARTTSRGALQARSGGSRD